MRSNTIGIITPTTVTNTNFATALTGAGPFSTWTRTDIADGQSHKISLTSGQNLSAITMTIVGTDADGRSITEARAGPNINTVFTTAFFKTIVSLTAGATLGANTMDVGFNQELATICYPVDYKARNPTFIGVNVTGTINFTVQETLNPVLSPDDANRVPVYTSLAALTSKTANTFATGTAGATGLRLITTSYTAGATWSLITSQSNV